MVFHLIPVYALRYKPSLFYSRLFNDYHLRLALYLADPIITHKVLSPATRCLICVLSFLPSDMLPPPVSILKQYNIFLSWIVVSLYRYQNHENIQIALSVRRRQTQSLFEFVHIIRYFLLLRELF